MRGPLVWAAAPAQAALQRAGMPSGPAGEGAGDSAALKLGDALDKAGTQLRKPFGSVAQLDPRLEALWRGEAVGSTHSWGLAAF